MELLLLSGLLGTIPLFCVALMFVDYLEQRGQTVEERKAILFEIYRYGICFWTMLLFGFSTFQIAVALIGESANPQALIVPSLGAGVSALFFGVHWFIKFPASKPKAE